VPELDTKNASVYQGLEGGQNRPGIGDLSAEIPNCRKKPKSPFRRLSTFVCAISVLVVAAVLCGDVEKGSAAQIVSMTKSYPSAVLETVVVSDFPEDKKPSFVRFGVDFKVVKRFAISRLRPFFRSSFWSKDNIPLQDTNAEKLLGFGPVFAEFPVNKPAYMTGGQISGVVDENIASDTVVVARKWANAAGFYADIGTLKDSGIEILPNPSPDDTPSNQNQKSRKQSKIHVSDSEIAIIFLRPIIFFLLGIGVAILGYNLQSARCKHAKWCQRAGLILACSSPLIFAYGFWGFL